MTQSAPSPRPSPDRYLLLVELERAQLITREQHIRAADHARRHHLNPRAALVQTDVLADDTIRAFLMEHTGYPIAPHITDLNGLQDLLPDDERRHLGAAPFKLDDKGLHVAFTDPLYKRALRTIRDYAPSELIPYIAATPTLELDEPDTDLASFAGAVLDLDEDDEPATPDGDTPDTAGAEAAAEAESLADVRIDPEVHDLLPDDFIREHRILPLYVEDATLHLLMAEGTSLLALDDVRNLSGYEVAWATRNADDIDQLIDKYYNEDQDLQELAAQAQGDLGFSDVDEDEEDANISDSAIVKLVNGILKDAISRGVSDIHIHPFEDVIRVRFREDGVLITYQELQRNLLSAVIARIKVLSGLDIAKKRSPQDGRMRFKQGGRVVDFRVSTLPTVVGEKAVMRLLKGGDELIKIPQLGFTKHNQDRFVHAIEQPYGMLLVTGPTGSGKSFTLFSAMDHLNQPDVNICTVEDPVEYRLPGLAQVQVNNKAGLTFAGALRSFLRQDPDIVMVGEIRDEETAKIATEAALTGHLVLATLHTNDAPGAITRLAEMGVERFNITASLLGVLAQRLVRRVCKFCGQPAEPNPELVKALGITPEMLEGATYRMGEGCNECNHTGYRGRTAVHELLTKSEELETAIIDGQATDGLREIGRRTGMTTLREDAITKALQGITTLEEVVRVTAD